MAAVLACGDGAVLSHHGAAALWGMKKPNGIYDISIPDTERHRPGIRVHRRTDFTDDDVTRRNGIPVTTAATTLIDLAATSTRRQLDAAMVEADKRDLITLSMLQLTLTRAPRRPGAAAMRALLRDWTFTLTDSELERLFIPIAKRAALPAPEAGADVNGYKVDFFFESIGLVIETDGGRFHRTAAQQTRDRIRDQRHLIAGLTPIRFTHHQIAHDPTHVEAVLRAAVQRASS